MRHDLAEVVRGSWAVAFPGKRGQKRGMLFRRKQREPTIQDAVAILMRAARDLPIDRDWVMLAQNAELDGEKVGDWSVCVRRLSTESLHVARLQVDDQLARNKAGN